MKIDNYGQPVYSENDLCELFLKDPNRKLNNVLVDKPIIFSDILELENIPLINVNVNKNQTVYDFDNEQQSTWFMPKEYTDLDIAKHVLELCKNDEELQRAGKELFLFQERGMFPLLQYLKYLVDTMKKNNIVWGVGRGSSVASFVLFLLEVHRINSLYYDLPIEEFLK